MNKLSTQCVGRFRNSEDNETVSGSGYKNLKTHPLEKTRFKPRSLVEIAMEAQKLDNEDKNLKNEYYKPRV